MLERGMKPSLIQAYFTRPGRLVNPARIQEFKKGSRPHVGAADDETIDDFLDDFAAKHPDTGLYAPPKQEEEASTFKLREDGRLSLVSEAPTNKIDNIEDVEELYHELKTKAVAFAGLGHNVLGDLLATATTFSDAFPENPEDASVIKIWMRGNTLRSKLKSYQEQQDNPDSYPLVAIDSSAAPSLEDLCESFNVLTALVPALAALDTARCSGEEAESRKDALQTIQPAIDLAESVATEEVVQVLGEQVATGIGADDNEFGRKQTRVAYSSTRNFAVAIFTPIYRVARAVFSEDKLPNVVKSLRNGAFTALGKKFTERILEKYPAFVEYIHGAADYLGAFAERVIDSPVLAEFMRHILHLLN